MEEVRGAGRYWCHGCSQVVDPVMEMESIKCSLCSSDFVEEVESLRSDYQTSSASPDSDRAISLWAPILLGMMTNPRRRLRRPRRVDFDRDDYDDEEGRRHFTDGNESRSHRHQETADLEMLARRRRRSSAAIFQLLQDIRSSAAGIAETDVRDGGEDRDRDWRMNWENHVILINPFDQTVVVQGSGPYYDPEELSGNHNAGSLGDYFIGPSGLEQLLQHLAENDPNRHGTPPAKKEAVEAMPTIKVEEGSSSSASSSSQCSVCLDEFEVGDEAREMPCKHRFHGGCILPWLELHSSCPVCRHQLPSDESKVEREQQGSRIDGATHGGIGEEGDGSGRRSDVGRRFPANLPWPFSSLFSSSGSQSTTSNPSSSSSSDGHEGASHAE